MSATFRRLGLAAAATLLGLSTAAAGGFSVEPEAVFLKFSESKFPFAVEGDPGDTISDGTVAQLTPDYDLGFRFGIGWNWEGWWDIHARWTHIDTFDRGMADDSMGTLWGTTVHPTSGFFNDDDFRAVAAEQDLDLDYFDIEAGKTWNSDNGGSVRLFFGARLSWFDQDAATINFRTDTIWEVVETRLDWEGFGPLVGVEGHVPIGSDSGWSFFGSAAGSVQFGDSRGSYTDHYVPDSTMKAATEVLQFDYLDESSSTAVVLEGRIGFAWEKEYDSTTFGLRFGYEYQTWDGLASTASLVSDAQANIDLRTSDNFDLHGFFFRFGWTW